MRHIATQVVLVMLTVVVGCGSNVGGGVTLAQARTTCVTWENADGTTVAIANAAFNSLVITAEAVRDSGITEFGYLSIGASGCDDPLQIDPAGCFACITQIAAAVYDE